MPTARAFRQILDLARPPQGDGCSPEDAAAILAASCLVILSDDVVTVMERSALVTTLRQEFGIQIEPPMVPQLLGRVADVPRNILLQEIAAQCRHWPAERVEKLMRALWSCAALDQNLACGEAAILTRLGAHLGWKEKEQFGTNTVANPRDASVLARIGLAENDVLRVGRSLEVEICLHRAPIAAVELLLTYRSERLAFQMQAPELSVTFRGRAVATGLLSAGEELAIGRYRLRLESNRELLVIYPGFAAVLEAKDLAAALPAQGRRRYILQGVNFHIAAGEMLAIIGPSGCGKSTLLSLLRGDRAVAQGRVTLDGVEVKPGATAVVRRMSLVPQEELLLATLTVDETVTYAARLKGVGGSRAGGVMTGLIDEILDRVGLTGDDLRGTAVGDEVKRGISGGQRRRVSVAQELVGDDTDVLLLDEPTSGLDPRSEAGILALMRDLADSGRVVVASTHAIHPDALNVFDRVLCLNGSGQVEYVGSPSGFFQLFGTSSTADIFERLDATNALPPVARSPEPGDDADSARVTPPVAAVRRLALPAQLSILTRREAKMRLRDPASLALALALPVTVAGLCSLVYQPECVQPSLLFVLCLTSVWTGVSFTVRDLISNFAVLRHESRTRATPGAAYAAKALIATGAACIQALILTAALFWIFGARRAASFDSWPPAILEHADLIRPWLAFLVLWVCHCFGNALGLVLSASFRTAAAAIFMIPFVILPMVTFSGMLVPPRNLRTGWQFLMPLTPLYQGYVGLLGSTMNVCSSPHINVDDPAQTDRSVLCGRSYRTVPAPTGDSGVRPYVQDEASCRNNLYQRTGEFCHQMQLCPPDPNAPFTGRISLFRNAAFLTAFTGALHLLALTLLRRRMNTV